MSRKTKLKFDIIILLSLMSTSTLAIANTYYHRLLVSGLVLALFISFLARRIITNLWNNRYVLIPSFLFDVACISFIVFLDEYNISYMLFYILAIEMVIQYFSGFSILIGALSYLAYIFIDYFKYIKNNYFDFEYLLPIYVNKTFYFIFVLGTIYLISYQYKSKLLLKKTADELVAKTHELEEINRKYCETMEALEEVTALKERNRIASEIHDTVGHTLTTVLIEIEAGKRLLNKNYEKAIDKFNLAQEQVRKGLNNIRNSVHTLKEGNDILSIIPSLYLLVQETEKHTDVSVKCLFSPLPYLSKDTGKILYKALQEGLTNGIRHGRSTHFICSLCCKDNKIIFSLEDNGIGFDKINLGYGLSTMKERVKQSGGTLSIYSKNRQGCCLTLEIPVSNG